MACAICVHSLVTRHAAGSGQLWIQKDVLSDVGVVSLQLYGVRLTDRRVAAAITQVKRPPQVPVLRAVKTRNTEAYAYESSSLAAALRPAARSTPRGSGLM